MSAIKSFDGNLTLSMSYSFKAVKTQNLLVIQGTPGMATLLICLALHMILQISPKPNLHKTGHPLIQAPVQGCFRSI